jgi:hypothetical protein
MEIYSKERAMRFSSGLFVFLWFGFATIIPVVDSYNPVGFGFWVIFVLFLIVGYVCLVYDVYNFLQWRSFGAVVFRTDNYPKVGGKLDGYLVFSKAMKPDVTLDVTFRCEHRKNKKIKLEKSFNESINHQTTSTSNDKFITEENVSDKFVTEENTSGEVFTHITLNIPIPWSEEAPEWYIRECYKYYHWTLIVKSEFKGIYLSRNYPIIVL